MVDILLPSLSEESYSKVSEWRKRKREGEESNNTCTCIDAHCKFFSVFLGYITSYKLKRII